MKLFKSLLLILFIYTSANGQGEFSLYNLNRTVPQAHQLNPAFYPDAKIVIGLPVISSTHLSVDMDQLSFNQVFTESAEQSLTVDFDNISSQLREKNNFSVQSDIQLFFLGLNLNDNFFSLAINDRISSWMVYSKDLADLAIYGNGDSRTFGRNLSLDNMLLRQNLYHEIALGFAKSINQKISVGARVKFLFGVLNSQTEQMNGYIRTDSDSIHLSNTNITFRSSGYDYLSDDRDILSIYRSTLPLTNGNNGFGLDLGVEYQVTDRINISASVTDLGYINWKENTQSYSINADAYSFKGFDIVDLINNDGGNNNFFQNELDSLKNMFTPEELEGISYKSSLTSNFYTGFDYKLADKHHVGVQAYSKMANGNITPEFGAYYNIQLGQVFNAVVNASFRNGKIHAAGIGASVNLGPIQIYGTTESITSLINPEAATLLDARFGINLIFGRKKKAKKEEVVEEQEEIIPVEDSLVESSAIPEEVETEVIESVAEESIPIQAAAIAAVAMPEVDPIPEEIVEPEQKIIEPESFKESPVVVVKQGDHKDELELGHYIVVGAFLSKANVQKYSAELKTKGFDNQYGFLTEKEYYYVTVYKNSGDIEKAREVRTEYRKKKDFLFRDTWLLSVVE